MPRLSQSRKELLGRILLLAASTCSALLLAEAAVRLLFRDRFDTELLRAAIEPTSVKSYARPSADPALFIELIPDLDLDLGGWRVITDREGVRVSGSPPEPAAAGAVRIAVLGDSTSFGLRVNYEDSYPERYRSRMAAETGVPVELRNYSVPAYNSRQELRVFLTKVLAYRPDLIVLHYDHNDAEPTGYRFSPAYIRPEYGDNFLHSALLKLTLRKLAEVRNRRLAAFDDGKQQYVGGPEGYIVGGPLYEGHLDALKSLADTARSLKIPVAVVVFNAFARYDAAYASSEEYALLGKNLEARLEAMGLNVLDLVPLYQEKMREMGWSDLSAWWVSRTPPVDGHPNPEGHEFIADRLVEFTHGRPELRRVFQERGTAPASLPAASSDTPRPLKIATWNIRWLTPRDSRSGRAEADYAALRRHAKLLDADLVALQEVDGAEAARLVFDPRDYRFHFTRDVDTVQRAGFVWKKELDVRPNPDLESLAAAGRRRGADVTLRWGGRDLRLLGVHLKSGCPSRPLSADDEDCRILRAQLPALEAWVDARAREGAAFAVLGDFNREFDEGDPFWTDLDDGDPPGADLTDVGAGARPACFGGRFKRYIDHIVLSPPVASWLVPASFHELVFAPGADPNGGLSDHCPLSVVLEAGDGPGRATAPERVSASDAAAHVGRLVSVCGPVASARALEDGSRMTFLNLGAPYPHQPFTIVIRAADRAAFGAPEQDLLGKNVCVTGTIESYRGKPQIAVRTPDQIRIDAAR